VTILYFIIFLQRRYGKERKKRRQEEGIWEEMKQEWKGRKNMQTQTEEREIEMLEGNKE
jgi:hypothetical protein